MKRLLSFCLLVFSLTVSSSAREWPPIIEEDMSETIRTFYRAYVANLGNDAKIDSLLSQYCTPALKSAVQEAIEQDDYDFVLNGYGGSVIDETLLFVAKVGNKYRVTFKVPKYPVSSGLATVTVNVLYDFRQDKITAIIRPSDNYQVP